MKNLKLNHEYTPSELAKVNHQILTAIAAEELDHALLKSLVEQRDHVIVEHLKSLDLEDEKRFANSELATNHSLSEYTSKELKSSLKQLSGLIRGRKAVNKYT